MNPVAVQGSLIVKAPPGTTYLSHGFSAHIYVALDHDYVTKRAKCFEDDDHNGPLFRGLLDNERKIYERIGSHDGVIGYRGYDPDSASITLAYAADGDLTEYIGRTPRPDPKMCSQMIKRISDTLLYIYSRNVAVQDIKADNVLMKHGLPKICDFGEGILYPLREKNMQDVCPKEVLGRDLLGTGDGLYSIATWKVVLVPSYESDEGEHRPPSLDDLTSMESAQFARIIENCWRQKYSSMEEFHSDVARVATEG